MSVGSNDGSARLTRSVTPTSAFTAAGWFLLLNLSVTTFPVLFEFDRTNADGQFLLSDGANTAFYAGNQGLATVSSGISTAVIGEWVYAALIFNDTTTTAYISRMNAASVTSSLTVTSSTVTDVTIHADSGNTFRQGALVGYVRTWGAALSQAELDAERTSPTAVKTANLLTDSPLTNVSTLNGWTIVGTATDGTDPPYLVYPAVTPSVSYLTA